MNNSYDAVLIVSFGGPEGLDDVMPFLERVLRGKNVPRQRMLEVAEHYQHFGGVSPINGQCRELIAALQLELQQHGPPLPIYWGNRNWHPLLPDTLKTMRDAGVQRALAFFTSAFGSYSGCRQYLENVAQAREEAGPGTPEVHKLRTFFNHPGFIEPMAQHVADALETIPRERRPAARLLFTAHSIPVAMSETSPYQRQLLEAARLVGQIIGRPDWRLVYQSRSGPPRQPWLEPDILDALRQLQQQGVRDVVVAPIGFLSDHMEVLFDLDLEAQQVCGEIGLNMVRAKTVGSHPRFISMIRELLVERLSENPVRLALGDMGAADDACPADCCPPPSRK